MDYKRLYDFIIERAKNRIIEGYTESHHIVPRCMGGGNEIENLVKLTAKEHFLVHRLLTLIYPYNSSLIYAYWAMCGLPKENRHIPSAKTYEGAKKQMAETTKKRLAKFNHWVGKKHSEESKIKQSKSAKIRNISPESNALKKQRLSKTLTGLKKTKEHKKNISKSKEGSKNSMFGVTGSDNKRSKPVQQFDLENNFIQDWENGKIASEKLGLNYKAINKCCNEKQATSGGFIWKFKNNINYEY